MNSLTQLILVFAALGSGMVAGLFASFSDFIMQALSDMPPKKGIAAMQSINLVIVKPTFLFVFLGTGVASVLAVGFGWELLGDTALVCVAAGAAVYVLGSIVVTIAFNVPLNNRLAAVDSESEEGTKIWEIYLVMWTRWNHVRTIATIISTLLFIMAVLYAEVHAFWQWRCTSVVWMSEKESSTSLSLHFFVCVKLSSVVGGNRVELQT